MPVHPTAIVSEHSSIDPTVHVGPYVVIEGDVTIGPECRIDAHSLLQGPMIIGKRNHIHSHAVLGGTPQDLKYNGEHTFVHIGDDNIFREFVTVHRGTAQGQSKTTIGKDNLFMAYSHVAHDCVIADRCILANGVTLAGHVHLADNVVVGGLSAIHQYVHVGRLAMIAGGSMVSQDVPPFMLVQGDRATIRGINRIGLRRNNIPHKDINQLHSIYKYFHQTSSVSKRLQYLSALSFQPYRDEFIAFLEQSTRGLCKCKP